MSSGATTVLKPCGAGAIVSRLTTGGRSGLGAGGRGAGVTNAVGITTSKAGSTTPINWLSWETRAAPASRLMPTACAISEPTSRPGLTTRGAPEASRTSNISLVCQSGVWRYILLTPNM
jgi:hypothetical protein